LSGFFILIVTFVTLILPLIIIIVILDDILLIYVVFVLSLDLSFELYGLSSLLIDQHGRLLLAIHPCLLIYRDSLLNLDDLPGHLLIVHIDISILLLSGLFISVLPLDTLAFAFHID